MKSEINNIEKIEAYLSGEITGQEKLDFEKELEINPELQKELELHKDIHRSVNQKSKERLKAELESYYDDYKHGSHTKRSITRYLIPVISIAATITLVLFLVFNDSSNQDQNQDFITLDSAKVIEEPNYADSASYENGIEEDTIIEELKVGE